MSKKSIYSQQNYVIANLVATYDMSPSNERSVTSIDYLCIYEYEYNGKKYKYETHKKDNFSPVPETIELVFGEDPSQAYRVNNSSPKISSKSSLSILIWGFLILVILLIIFFVYDIVPLILNSEINIFPLLISGVLMISIGIKSSNKQKKRDKMIENAILNNRTVTAYLAKTRYLKNSLSLQSNYTDYYYRAKYTYNYNGKKYTKSFRFSSSPPTSIKLFFGKNPKDIIHFTR